MHSAPDFSLLDPTALKAVASPLRQQLVAALDTPDTAANLARRFDMSRQRIGYHMRDLEQAGCIEAVGERANRGLTEKLFRARPLAWVAAPSAAEPAPRARDRLSWAGLVSALAGALWDLLRLRRAADEQGKRLATLALELEVRLPSPAARKAFTEEVLAALQAAADRHAVPADAEGRDFRLVLGAYPAPPPSPAPATGGPDHD